MPAYSVPPGENPAAMEDSGEQDFGLDSDPEEVSPRAAARRSGSGQYSRRIADYCELFGEPGKPLDRKTVERWISRGRDVENLPPLDQPESMAAWWRVVIRRKVPQVLISLERKKEEGAAEGAAESGVSGGDVAGLREMRDLAGKMASGTATGFHAALERAHAAERAAWAEWQISIQKPDSYSQAQADRRKKSWEDSMDAMRKAELVAEKLMARSDEWATWEEVERELSEKIPVIAVGVRSLWVRVATKLSLPPGLFQEVAPIFGKEVDKLFDELARGGFRPVLDLEG